MKRGVVISGAVITLVGAVLTLIGALMYLSVSYSYSYTFSLFILFGGWGISSLGIAIALFGIAFDGRPWMEPVREHEWQMGYQTQLQFPDQRPPQQYPPRP